jgi:hypothetical protein
MTELKLPCFKDVELDFLDECCQVLAPVAVALDRLQGEENCYYADLLPTLFRVGSHLTSLQSVNLRHCGPLLNSVTTGFNRRFADFLKLSPEREVNMAILASLSYPYFKLRWLPNSLADQRSRLQALFVSSAKSMTNPTALDVPLSKGDDTDDDYFGFAAADCEATSSKDLNSTTKCELEALQFLED